MLLRTPVNLTKAVALRQYRHGGIDDDLVHHIGRFAGRRPHIHKRAADPLLLWLRLCDVGHC